MRIAFNVIGVVAILIGALWILQGTNVIGGSVMSGQSLWLYIGIVVAVAGLAALWFANRRR